MYTLTSLDQSTDDGMTPYAVRGVRPFGTTLSLNYIA